MGGKEINKTDHPTHLVEIIDKVRDFFALGARCFTYKDCYCQAWGDVLIDIDQVDREFKSLCKKLEEKEKEDKVYRCVDCWSVMWFAVAHEYAHCLQASEVSWLTMKADPVPYEIGADFLAGACLGWYAVDLNINFLNDIDFAFQIAAYDSITHPQPHQRRLALETGISKGAQASYALGGDLSKIKRAELLDQSRACFEVVLKATTRKT
jgi:hypothetical protein